ncbi:MAG: sensory rhodopsin transducer [Eubacteriales bacterium]|nr:sensory rhodopsin transducer [Eubacteriales bacterium]
MQEGKLNWIFPDAELPPKGEFELQGHESLIVLNTNDQEAQIKITLYFTDKEPCEEINVTVGARRVRCLRTNNPDDMGGFTVPENEQYAIKMESNVPVVIQYGRLDTRNQPMHFYINQGYCY